MKRRLAATQPVIISTIVTGILLITFSVQATTSSANELFDPVTSNGRSPAPELLDPCPYKRGTEHREEISGRSIAYYWTCSTHYYSGEATWNMYMAAKGGKYKVRYQRTTYSKNGQTLPYDVYVNDKEFKLIESDLMSTKEPDVEVLRIESY